MAKMPEFKVSIHSAACLAQYLGVWAYEPRRFRAAVEEVRAGRIPVRVHGEVVEASIEDDARRDRADRYGVEEVIDGIAVIPLRGTLMKGLSKFDDGTSTISARRAIRWAVRNPDVQGLLLRVDSPGGTVAGTQELGDDIRQAGKQKPTWAQIEDLGASAAYWAASQTAKVCANRTAEVGSIGTYAVIEDYSRAAAEAGITVHVVSTGEFKGLGVPGTEVTDAQLEKVQALVDGLNEHFLAAVREGRGMSAGALKKLATGETFLASRAQEVGLIDGVQGFDATLAGLGKAIKEEERARRSRAKARVRGMELGRLEG